MTRKNRKSPKRTSPTSHTQRPMYPPPSVSPDKRQRFVDALVDETIRGLQPLNNAALKEAVNDT